MRYVFDRVQVRASWWSRPPIDPRACVVLTGSLACVLWIIVLLKAMTVRKDLLDEWFEMSFQNAIHVELCIHQPCKNRQGSGATMFRPRHGLCRDASAAP